MVVIPGCTGRHSAIYKASVGFGMRRFLGPVPVDAKAGITLVSFAAILVLCAGVPGPVRAYQRSGRNVSAPDSLLWFNSEHGARWHSAPEMPDNLNGSPPGDYLRLLTERLSADGYLAAEIDSLVRSGSTLRIYVRPGVQSTIERIRVQGQRLFSDEAIVGYTGLHEGSPLRAQDLAGATQAILEAFGAESFHDARVAIWPTADLAGSGGVDLVISIDEGPRTRLAGFVLPGGSRTREALLLRETGMHLGEPVPLSVIRSAAQELRFARIFETVGNPGLSVYPDSTFDLELDVRELPPGTFDLVLGILPSPAPGDGAQVIGSGHLDLLNPFGYGREFSVLLDRLPGRSSRAHIGAADPWIVGLPFRLAAAFDGYQRDSTYSQTGWEVETGYRIKRGVRVGVRFQADRTRPGQAGIAFSGANQRIPRSDRRFWGVSAEINSLDDPVTPRSGFQGGLSAARGSRESSRLFVTGDQDTTLVRSSIDQERLSLDMSGFLATASNQTVMLRVQVHVLGSANYTEDELFRVGGASTLRGYDEDRFAAHVAIIFSSEYRVYLGDASFAFLFTDVGYLEQPRTAIVNPDRFWKPGFGAGMRWRTAAGLLRASYAINPDDGFLGGRIHMGVAFGL